MRENIILTGFMGTGKSTLGHLLAHEIGYDFIDTDSEIEKRVKKTIGDLFRDEGEAYFRQLEHELVLELAEKERLVISTGGGLVMNPDNVSALNRRGEIICLTATPEEILERVSSQQQVRPLLLEDDPLKKINDLLQQRTPVYSQFKQLATSEKTPEELINQLLNLIQPC